MDHPRLDELDAKEPIVACWHAVGAHGAKVDA